MRKAGTIAAVAVLVFAVFTFGVGTREHKTSADDARSIPVTASTYTESKALNVGDSCAMHVEFPRMMLTPAQITVKDENGKVLAIRSLDGGTWETSAGGSGLMCTIEFSIDLPEAEFYVVYLNDERVRGYSKSEFPIQPGSEISLSLD